MNDTGPNPETRIALFQRKEVRRTIHNNEWWFVVEDVVLALIDSRDPKQYIQRMKQRDPELGKGWVQIVHTLFIPTDGADRDMRGACAPRKLAFFISSLSLRRSVPMLEAWRIE